MSQAPPPFSSFSAAADLAAFREVRHRHDPIAFARALGLSVDPWQERVLRSDSKRLLLNCCRQSGKSTIASVKALHRALYEPDSLILMISPSLRQSGELFRKMLGYLNKLGSAKPKMAEENRLSVRLANGSRVISLPGAEETTRGFTATLVILDEAARIDDGLYKAVRPMIAIRDGGIIAMSTPFGMRGWFYKEWTEGEGWESVRIPATECPRLKREFLREEERSLGRMWFSAEYLCQFVANDAAFFDPSDVRRAITDDVRALFAEATVPDRSMLSDFVEPLFDEEKANG